MIRCVNGSNIVGSADAACEWVGTLAEENMHAITVCHLGRNIFRINLNYSYSAFLLRQVAHIQAVLSAPAHLPFQLTSAHALTDSSAALTPISTPWEGAHERVANIRDLSTPWTSTLSTVPTIRESFRINYMPRLIIE